MHFKLKSFFLFDYFDCIIQLYMYRIHQGTDTLTTNNENLFTEVVCSLRGCIELGCIAL